MDALVAFGLQPAAAGEFTMRAFEAGKLDLTQAEALADLLDAETEAQRRQALGQLGGRLSERAGEWRRLLLTGLAAIEAGVDFPDEEDVPAEMMDDAEAARLELIEAVSENDDQLMELYLDGAEIPTELLQTAIRTQTIANQINSLMNYRILIQIDVFIY